MWGLLRLAPIRLAVTHSHSFVHRFHSFSLKLSLVLISSGWVLCLSVFVSRVHPWRMTSLLHQTWLETDPTLGSPPLWIFQGRLSPQLLQCRRVHCILQQTCDCVCVCVCVFCRRGREREIREREREREERDALFCYSGCGNTHPNSFQLVFHTSIKDFMHVKRKEYWYPKQGVPPVSSNGLVDLHLQIAILLCEIHLELLTSVVVCS